MTQMMKLKTLSIHQKNQIVWAVDLPLAAETKISTLMKKYQSSLDNINITLILEPRHFGALTGQALNYIELNQYEKAIINIRIRSWSLDQRNGRYYYS